MNGHELLTKLRDRDDPTSLRDIPAPQVYTVAQVAGLLGVGRGTAYELIRAGKIPAKQIGRRWIVPREAFHTWLTDLEASA
ncbi:helix-turn-helix domain-containing protein [Actinomycetospora chibensis]|uniref:Helix-turn-helix domain-containing protein n=1 Tax=Actinomycetospora chibensis TaxID=663606 RepID=A0ABV9RR93_9PSEU|nr:helix-turn-helix domain-containing protein [Actinomycetospora chibensis]MDD7927405.1 helix-turn-helix domain-containing protein [Actinomycetospora chibensis]